MSIEASERELACRQRFESWLAAIVRNDLTHARLVNTLSMLEHIGSVKIARTQARPGIDSEILQHLAEEARHADVLKRMVHRLVGDALPDFNDVYLLAGAAARGYFGRLDAMVRRWARANVSAEMRHAASYNFVTWLVERRAMWLYPAYQRELDTTGARISVRAIIGEETRHLEDVESALERLGLLVHPSLAELVRDEENAFERFVDVMITSADDGIQSGQSPVVTSFNEASCAT